MPPFLEGISKPAIRIETGDPEELPGLTGSRGSSHFRGAFPSGFKFVPGSAMAEAAHHRAMFGEKVDGAAGVRRHARLFDSIPKSDPWDMKAMPDQAPFPESPLANMASGLGAPMMVFMGPLMIFGFLSRFLGGKTPKQLPEARGMRDGDETPSTALQEVPRRVGLAAKETRNLIKAMAEAFWEESDLEFVVQQDIKGRPVIGLLLPALLHDVYRLISLLPDVIRYRKFLQASYPSLAEARGLQALRRRYAWYFISGPSNKLISTWTDLLAQVPIEHPEFIWGFETIISVLKRQKSNAGIAKSVGMIKKIVQDITPEDITAPVKELMHEFLQIIRKKWVASGEARPDFLKDDIIGAFLTLSQILGPKDPEIEAMRKMLSKRNFESRR